MIICQTPLRVSFTGGGTDLEAYWKHEAGAVVSSAIDKYVFVIVNERFDDKIYVNYSRKEIVDRVDDVEHDLVREALRMSGVAGGLEITTLADIPSAGSGLGSSSSITVGLLQALYAHRGQLVDAERLAQEACHIEIDVLGKPIGRQDQYIAAYGGLRRFDFRTDGTVGVRSFDLAPDQLSYLSDRILLFFTGLTRSANTILAEQQANTQHKMSELRALRSLVDRVESGISAQKFACIGEALAENWRIKQRLAAGVSNPRIEEMVSLAAQGGATGCKISGAGGGGFLLCYCPLENQERLRKTLDRRELPLMLERDGSKIIFNYRRYNARR